MSRHDSLKPLKSLHLEEKDICRVIFSREKAAKACGFFIEWLKTSGGEASRAQVSKFAHELGKGNIENGFTYRRQNVYKTILRRLIGLGFISLQPCWEEGRYVHKYAPVYQPIPKRAPLGGQSFWRLAWEVAKKWNTEFEG